MATPTVEHDQQQDTDRDNSRIYGRLGRIEGRQEQGLKRLDDTNQSVRDTNERVGDLEKKVDRYFLTLLSVTIGGFVALLSITIGGFIALANMIANIAGG